MVQSLNDIILVGYFYFLCLNVKRKLCGYRAVLHGVNQEYKHVQKKNILPWSIRFLYVFNVLNCIGNATIYLCSTVLGIEFPKECQGLNHWRSTFYVAIKWFNFNVRKITWPIPWQLFLCWKITYSLSIRASSKNSVGLNFYKNKIQKYGNEW